MKWKLVVSAYVNDEYTECQFAVLKDISLKTINKILSLRDRLEEIDVDGFILKNCVDINFYKYTEELPGDYDWGDEVNFFTNNLDLNNLSSVEETVDHIELEICKHSIYIRAFGRYSGNIYDTSVGYDDLKELKKRLTNLNNQ